MVFFKVMGRKPVQPPQLGEPFGIRRAFTKRFPLGQVLANRRPGRGGSAAVYHKP